jgi:hypothetical protein
MGASFLIARAASNQRALSFAGRDVTRFPADAERLGDSGGIGRELSSLTRLDCVCRSHSVAD